MENALSKIAQTVGMTFAPQTYQAVKGAREDAKYKNALQQFGDMTSAGDFAGASKAIMPYSPELGFNALSMGREVDQQQRAQESQLRTQDLENLLNSASEMRQMPVEARMGFAQRMSQQFGLPMPASMEDLSDAALDEDLAMLRTQLGMGAPEAVAPQPMEPIKVGNRLIHPETYEVLYEPPAEAPAGPKPMSPYQAASLALQEARLKLDRDEFEAGQQPDYSNTPPAFQVSRPYPNNLQFVPANDPNLGGQFMPAGFNDFMLDQGYENPFGQFVEQQTRNQQPVGMNNRRYETYKSSEQAKADVKRLTAINDDGTEIRNNRKPKLQQMRDLIRRGVPIGPLAQQRVGAGKLGIDFKVPFGPEVGMSKEDAGMAETFFGLSTELQLGLTQRTKGAISDREMEAFSRSVPNWTQTPEGALIMIDTLEAMDQRTLEFQEAANQWTQFYGGTSMPNEYGETFDEMWKKYSEANPIMRSSSNSMTDVIRAGQRAIESSEQSGLSDDEEARYQELLRKQQEGTLQ